MIVSARWAHLSSQKLLIYLDSLGKREHILSMAVPCWCQRSVENGQTASGWWEGNSYSNNQLLQTRYAEEQVGYSSRRSPDIWKQKIQVTVCTGSAKLDSTRLEKHCLVSISAAIWIVGSEFIGQYTNNIKAWISPTFYQRLRHLWDLVQQLCDAVMPIWTIISEEATCWICV